MWTLQNDRLKSICEEHCSKPLPVDGDVISLGPWEVEVVETTSVEVLELHKQCLTNTRMLQHCD
jgi:hypothetical protein